MGYHGSLSKLNTKRGKQDAELFVQCLLTCALKRRVGAITDAYKYTPFVCHFLKGYPKNCGC
jgi:hypothetical protein